MEHTPDTSIDSADNPDNADSGSTLPTLPAPPPPPAPSSAPATPHQRPVPHPPTPLSTPPLAATSSSSAAAAAALQTPRTPAPPAPPPPPPPTPLTTTAAAAANPAAPALTSFVGSLDMLQKAALRQTRWPLVLIVPPAPRRTTARLLPPSSLPPPLHASPNVAASVMLWRRVSTSADAQRYTNFFPVDGLPHVALLDPRSGERLAVWGNGAADMAQDDGGDGDGDSDPNALSDKLWQAVLEDVEQFLPQHSLDEGKLGPMHRAEKPWAVRTRRTTGNASATAQQSTSLLDDEEAAMAAAIAASLADMEGATNASNGDDDDDDDNQEVEFDDVDEDDDVDDDDGETSNDMNSTTDVESIAPSTSSPMLPSAIPSSPVPTRRLAGGPSSQPSTPIPMATPSSVESLSSSYLDRIESNLRSFANPKLAERRRLRQSQDAELQEALEKDRAKAEAKRRAETAVRDAAARLPAEPADEDPSALNIALRLPDGKRLARRFPAYVPVRALADLVTANGGSVPGAAFSRVAGVFSSPGLNLSAATWDTTLADLKLPRRSLFMVQP